MNFHVSRSSRRLIVIMTGVILPACPVQADDLYRQDVTQSLGVDQRASRIGDILTVVIVQAAESSTSMQNNSRKGTGILGSLGIGSIDENADLSLDGNYNGRGELRRSESFVTQMTASITQILPNGDYLIGGQQHLRINGEETTVEVRGRVRETDIDSENRVASNRIADAQINYRGKGFVSRSAKPGILQRIFGFLGLI